MFEEFNFQEFVSYLVQSFPLILSTVAVIVSAISAFLTYQHIRISSRPYLVVESHSYTNELNEQVDELNVQAIITFQSAAKITEERYQYFKVAADEIIEVFVDHSMKNCILYPSSIISFKRYNNLDIARLAFQLASNEELKRTADVIYRGLNDQKEYFFKGEWRFDISTQKWITIKYDAN